MTTAAGSGAHHVHPARQFNGAQRYIDPQPSASILHHAASLDQPPQHTHRDLNDEPPPFVNPLRPKAFCRNDTTFPTVDCQPIRQA